MLQFFRKYQQFFFLVVTVAVIFSFCFFGTFSVLQDSFKKKPDRIVGKAIDGSKIYESDVNKMSQFLLSDRNSDPSGEKTAFNILNDGVVRKDLLETGIASLIAENYFSVLAPMLSLQWDKVKRFRPYQHPDVPFLNASVFWGRFAPKINSDLESFKKQETFGLKEFDLLASLYVQQADLPASALKRWIVYQQKQIPEIPFDQRLYHDDLSLFGFHTLADWFSGDFLDLLSQFICNIAVAAEKEGLALSKGEAREDLWENFQAYMKRSFSKDQIAQADLRTIFQRQILSLGMDEKSVIEVWRKILLFRKFFETKASGINLDLLAKEELASFAGEKITVENYSLPKHLQCKSLRDVFLLQTYIKAVSPQKSTSLDLPREYYPLTKIKETSPSLVKKSYILDMAQVSRSEIGLKVKVKEMWQWQIEDKNWQILTKEFPVLAAKNASKDRFSQIRSVEDSIRAKIDAFSVSKIIDEHPQWIHEALSQKAFQTKELSNAFVEKGLLLGVKNTEKFLALLDNSPLIDQKEISDEQRKVQEELSIYSEDNEVYSCFKVKERKAEEMISYAEALSTRLLDPILDTLLENKYTKLTAKDAKKWKNAEGNAKPFEEVKDEVGLLVFSDLIKAINTEVPDASFESDPMLRFHYFLTQAKSNLEKNPEHSDWTIEEKEGNLVSHQWKLNKKVQSYSHKDLQQEVFDPSLKTGDWLIRKVNICHLIGKERESAPLHSPKRDALMNEAKRVLAEKKLEEMKTLNAISFPLFSEQQR